MASGRVQVRDERRRVVLRFKPPTAPSRRSGHCCAPIRRSRSPAGRDTPGQLAGPRATLVVWAVDAILGTYNTAGVLGDHLEARIHINGRPWAVEGRCAIAQGYIPVNVLIGFTQWAVGAALTWMARHLRRFFLRAATRQYWDSMGVVIRRLGVCARGLVHGFEPHHNY
jgi:hypothetical protein